MAPRPTLGVLQPLPKRGAAPVQGETARVGGGGRAGETSPGDTAPKSPSLALLPFGEISIVFMSHVPSDVEFSRRDKVAKNLEFNQVFNSSWGEEVVSYFSLYPPCLGCGRHLRNVSCMNKLKKKKLTGNTKTGVEKCIMNPIVPITQLQHLAKPPCHI